MQEKNQKVAILTLTNKYLHFCLTMENFGDKIIEHNKNKYLF